MAFLVLSVGVLNTSLIWIVMSFISFWKFLFLYWIQFLHLYPDILFYPVIHKFCPLTDSIGMLWSVHIALLFVFVGILLFQCICLVWISNILSYTWLIMSLILSIKWFFFEPFIISVIYFSSLWWFDCAMFLTASCIWTPGPQLLMLIEKPVKPLVGGALSWGWALRFYTPPTSHCLCFCGWMKMRWPVSCSCHLLVSIPTSLLRTLTLWNCKLIIAIISCKNMNPGLSVLNLEQQFLWICISSLLWAQCCWGLKKTKWSIEKLKDYEFEILFPHIFIYKQR